MIFKPYQTKTKLAIIKRQTQYYQKRSKKLQQKRKLNYKEWSTLVPRNIANNPPKYYQLRNRMSLYGITLKDYNNLFKQQNGLCAICSKKAKNKFELNVDHCHKTNIVRGLLCRKCNTGLGHFRDSIELLERGALYLQGKLFNACTTIFHK